MKRFLLVLIVLVLAVGLAAADKPHTAQLTIKNRSDISAVFRFYPVADGVVAGNPSLIVIQDGKTINLYSLLVGDYQVESYACGEATVYQAHIAGHFNLTVPACLRWETAIQQIDGGKKSIPME